MTGQLKLLVGTVFRDASPSLASAVDSVSTQVGHDLSVTHLLVDDDSTDDWRACLGSRLDAPSLHVRTVSFRSASRSRNFVLDEVERAFPDVDYICRLDADDRLAGPGVLAELGSVLLRDRPDVLIASNLQSCDGSILPRVNRATPDLRDPECLVRRLERMAGGHREAELPSCNTVVRRGLTVRYPSVKSAEDHWYATMLLLDPGLRVVLAPELVYAVYRLRGDLTRLNEKRRAYLESRRRLARFARARVGLEATHGSH